MEVTFNLGMIIVAVIGILFMLLPIYAGILPMRRRPCQECTHKGYWHTYFKWDCTMNHCTCERYR